MRRRKYIMGRTDSSRIYKAIKWSYDDPWNDHGCWLYKKAVRNWKRHRRTQYK